MYRSGVQHDVPLSSLVAAGCVPCYEAPYGTVSDSQDIISCTGPYLFVGTQKGDKQVLDVGALASVEILRTEASRSAPYLSNGVYWHFMKGCSFGFMAIEFDRISVVSTNQEVSWNLDQSVGCAFADELKVQPILDTWIWKKHVHNCPGA